MPFSPALCARLLSTALALFVLSLAGCAAKRPDVDPTAQIAEATGAPITFHTEAGRLDAPSEPQDTLSSSQALQLAIATSPEIQASLARVRIAMADCDQARLLPNPVLNVILRWGPGKPQIELSLAQDFIQALQIPARASAADNRLRAAAADSVIVALNVSAQVQEQYAAVQASEALVPVLKQRLALLDKLVATAQSRLEAMEGTRTDVATLNAQRIELQVEIDSTLLTEREDRLRLARLIGSPSSTANWSLDKWTSPQIGPQAEREWIETALRSRPELQSLAWKLKALGDDESLIPLLVWEGASVGVDSQRDDKWFTGPSISTPLPVFDQGQARKSRVIAEQIEARHEFTLTKRKVVEEVRVAFQTLEASKSNLARIHDQLVPVQQQRRRLAEDAYHAGVSDVTALFLAEQDLRIAEAREISIQKQTASALLRLQRAVGGTAVASSLGNLAATPPAP